MGRTLRILSTVLVATLIAAPALAAGGGVTVDVNDSKRLGLYGSAANVVVGDSSIADVTMVDSHSLVLTGKTYGRTHLMVFDAGGRTLLDTHVTVVAPEDDRVTVYRGATANEYSCAPRCHAITTTGGASGGSGGDGGAPSAPTSAPVVSSPQG